MAKALQRALLFYVTCGFIGFLPFAPGTWGSLFAGLLVYVLPGVFGNVVFLLVLTALSLLCIKTVDYQGQDPGYIVIDEALGMWVTMVGHETSIANTLIGFLLFRFFDIVKPWPVRKLEGLPRGYGIVADDVLAGIMANLLLGAGLLLRGRML
jgi:phosphatidylglycerophosphatase A